MTEKTARDVAVLEERRKTMQAEYKAEFATGEAERPARQTLAAVDARHGGLRLRRTRIPDPPVRMRATLIASLAFAAFGCASQAPPQPTSAAAASPSNPAATIAANARARERIRQRRARGDDENPLVEIGEATAEVLGEVAAAIPCLRIVQDLVDIESALDDAYATGRRDEVRELVAKHRELVAMADSFC